MADLRQIVSEFYRGTCPECGSTHWVAASLDGGRTRTPQCVPCGAFHRGVVLSDA